jgi:hypothetical protein
MDEAQARAVLRDTVQENDDLYCVSPWISLRSASEICLDGDFTADELEAIVWWMRKRLKRTIKAAHEE